MRLSGASGHIRNQILSMDPLPSVGKAYSMILRIEKQQEVHSGALGSFQEGVIAVLAYLFFSSKHHILICLFFYPEFPANPFPRRDFPNEHGCLRQKKTTEKRKGPRDKRQQFCDHCNRSGHTRQSCFKLLGYPDWYKTLMEQRRRNGRPLGRAFAVSEEGETSTQGTIRDIEGQLLELIRLEVGMMQEEAEVANANFVEFEDFAGISLNHTYPKCAS
ncbi:UNVERIFIED_CONTAM: hypothetical protein Slati_2136700 [Sesamum latifolium]|uniref:Gag-pol polyprotein n=1 Tax=Sesamum latifolium TaxID=2727402 RepID=A0AAW2WRU3_9LAMI